MCVCVCVRVCDSLFKSDTMSEPSEDLHLSASCISQTCALFRQAARESSELSCGSSSLTCGGGHCGQNDSRTGRTYRERRIGCDNGHALVVRTQRVPTMRKWCIRRIPC